MEYTLYKPNKKQAGGAFKFNVHKSGKFSFMKAAPQIDAMGSARVFGWDDDSKTINVKMGLSDLGAFLAVIYNFQEEAKLFHRTENDNKIIELKHVPSRGGFGLTVSHKVETTGALNKIFVGISYAEAAILKVYLEDTVKVILEANVWTGEQNA